MNLDPAFQHEAQPGLSINPEEKIKIIAFLHTLNDRSFLLDKKLSPP